MIFDPDAFAHGPIDSKIWLCRSLKDFDLPRVDNVYVLGAWSGTVAFLLHAIDAIEFDSIINVDIDSDYLAQSRVLCNVIECTGKLQTLLKDCNTLDYPLDRTNIVINTSTDNINSTAWYDRIPRGTIVALQGRTGGHRDCVQPYELLEDFNLAYPMAVTFTVCKREFVYPDHSYTRFMKIGIK